MQCPERNKWQSESRAPPLDPCKLHIQRCLRPSVDLCHVAEMDHLMI